MLDYSGLLSRIASALEQIAGAPNYFWVAPIAVLVSALVGFMASQRVIKKQREAESSRELRRKMLAFELLKDEITLRWQKDIEPHLRELLLRDPISGLGRLSTMAFRQDDVFIAGKISSSFSDYFFLENEALISKIIHAYLLYEDLIDYQATVRRFLAERSERRKALIDSLGEAEAAKKLDEEFATKAENLWMPFQTKLDEINARFLSILDEIAVSAG